MTVVPIGAVTSNSGTDLSHLVDLYQQQVTGRGVDPTSGVAASSAMDPAAAARGADFASMIGDGLKRVEGLDVTASNKAIQAATGDLTDVHDYVIAAQEAQVATELTTTLRNKALESFNEIMRMPL
jgi:flagellar hook-basal body complex protein FliE